MHHVGFTILIYITPCNFINSQRRQTQQLKSKDYKCTYSIHKIATFLVALKLKLT
jgi:hypothetical protein